MNTMSATVMSAKAAYSRYFVFDIGMAGNCAIERVSIDCDARITDRGAASPSLTRFAAHETVWQHRWPASEPSSDGSRSFAGRSCGEVSTIGVGHLSGRSRPH